MSNMQTLGDIPRLKSRVQKIDHSDSFGTNSAACTPIQIGLAKNVEVDADIDSVSVRDDANFIAES